MSVASSSSLAPAPSSWLPPSPSPGSHLTWVSLYLCHLGPCSYSSPRALAPIPPPFLSLSPPIAPRPSEQAPTQSSSNGTSGVLGCRTSEGSERETGKTMQQARHDYDVAGSSARGPEQLPLHRCRRLMWLNYLPGPSGVSYPLEYNSALGTHVFPGFLLQADHHAFGSERVSKAMTDV